MTTRDPDGDRPRDAGLERLVASRGEFVAFVARRVGDRSVAEDLVQDAFVKGLEHGGEIRDGESARAWFYRVLRNAVIDRHRRAATGAARLQQFADELARAEAERESATDREVCACIAELLPTLSPEQEEALRHIELDGVAVKAFAVERGIGESNAGVRVFRARRALRERITRACGTCAEHGCYDCSCKKPPTR